MESKLRDFRFEDKWHEKIQEVLDGNTRALVEAFGWERTPQRFNYWSTQYSNCTLLPEAREFLQHGIRPRVVDTEEMIEQDGNGQNAL